jgi:hypothetical protein
MYAKTARHLSSELAFLARAVKAPTLRQAVPRLAAGGRIRAARLPARTGVEEVDFDHPPRPGARDHRAPGHAELIPARPPP